MHDLIVEFEQVSNQLDALMEQFVKSLDMRSVGGDGYGLSKEINCKIGALLRLDSYPPVAPATP
jgi:hypothetical protein